MTLLNISLCLPAPDVVALQQKHSIVAITKRFIVPGKSFALLPCNDFPGAGQLDRLYQESFLEKEHAPNEEMPAVTHWANCELCQPIEGDSAIAAMANRTIWTKAAFEQHTEGPLFLSFLRVYKLTTALDIDTAPVCDQLYKFMPLPRTLDAGIQSSVFEPEEFVAAKKDLLAPDVSEPGETCLEHPQAEDDKSPVLTIEEILDGPDWVSKITEYGNSSDGHTFEKLVRKALIELGFSNSLSEAAASLDPDATGGAGGLDFYADQPFSLVGECKATGTKTVGDDPATQLHKLGLKHLAQEEYERCVPLIVAAGKITTHANKIAVGHRMNVIRPETLQALVALKIKLQDAIDLGDLKVYLMRSPFGTEADAKINSLIHQWQSDFKRKERYIQQRRNIIRTVQELAKQSIYRGKTAFVTVEIRAHHNAKYQPLITDEAAQEMLSELSSPLSGYLGRKHLPGDQERFYFCKDMPRE